MRAKDADRILAQSVVGDSLCLNAAHGARPMPSHKSESNERRHRLQSPNALPPTETEKDELGRHVCATVLGRCRQLRSGPGGALREHALVDAYHVDFAWNRERYLAQGAAIYA